MTRAAGSLPLLAFVVLMATGADARAGEPVSARFEIAIGGLQVGVAGLEGRISNDTYETSVSVRLSGVSRLIASGRGSASAKGRIAGGRLAPTSYSLNLVTSQQNETVRMLLAGGAVKTLTVEPERPPAADSIPLTMSHRQGVLDPLSAGLFLAGHGGPQMDPRSCAKTYPVFDGRQRYDLSFTYSREETLKVAGFDGKVLVCQARYKAIAGHRPAVTEPMEANREMEVWLAPVPGTRALVPAKIAIRTQFGMAVIEATRLELGAPAATASVRR